MHNVIVARRGKVAMTKKFAAIRLIPLLIGMLNFYPAALPVATGATLPSGFTETVLATINRPTSLAFTPDGRLLITTHPGLLRVYSGEQLLPNPALNLSFNNRICSNGERGLMGIVVDPAFAANSFIYLYYTFNKSGVCEDNSALSPVNRVSRFTLSSSNTINPASELVLIDNIPSPKGNHSAGALHFGKDGLLYISTGDGGCHYAVRSACGLRNFSSTDQHALTGKMLRITKTGGIPLGNPFRGADSARCNITGRTDAGKVCQEIFALGLRNPFRTAFDPNAATTRFYINDTGQDTWEEINLGIAGADYGWNEREGFCLTGQETDCGVTPANFTNPLFAYSHNDGCRSITGGVFVPNGVWPPNYNGAYLFADFVCGKIFRLVSLAEGGFTMTDFVTDLGESSPVSMVFGPHQSGQALYFTSYGNGGRLHRVAFSGSANRNPSAAATATPRFGELPLTVSFNGTASTDPDDDPLRYEWDFGDGTPPGTGATTSHTYSVEGRYLARLEVSDGRGGSAVKTLRIDPGHTSPQPEFLSPVQGTRFRVGQTIILEGSALDEYGNTLPDSALRWTVDLNHDDHLHPILTPTTGNNIAITAPIPEGLGATTTSYLIIKLVATDARGLSRTIVQRLNPQRRSISFTTQPAGLKLRVDGTEITTPQTLTSWEGYQVSVVAPNQTNANGDWTFDAWSDGGAQTHTITTPSTSRTYIATFR